MFLTRVAFVCFSLMSIPVWAGQLSSDFKMAATPSDPILITAGQVSIGSRIIEAPLFAINSLEVRWTGKGNLHLLRLLMTSSKSVNCIFDEDTLHALFPQLEVDSTGAPIIREGQIVRGRLPIFCGNIILPHIESFRDLSVNMGLVALMSDRDNALSGEVITAHHTLHVH